MPNSWIVDMRHFLGDDGLLAVRRGTLVPFLGAIVEAASAADRNAAALAEVRCRRRPGNKPCPGIIDAFIAPDSQAIAWDCPACGDDGYISHWHGTPWDRRPACNARPVSTSAPDVPHFTPAAERAWNGLPGSVRVRLLNNVFCVQCLGGRSLALEGGTMAGGDLVLRGTCTTCGHGVTRVVERAG